MKKGKVCVLGSFNLDIVAGMSRFPQPGESLIAHNSMMGAGGKGANQAVAALRAGARVHYIGKVGRDDFGTFARRHLDSAGFDAVTLFSTGDFPTGNALIYVAGVDAENMIAVDPGANLTFTQEEIESCRPAIAAADILLTQLENNLPAIEKVIGIAKEAGTYIILNPAPFQPVSDALLGQVDLLTPNATECSLLTGVQVHDLPSARLAAQLLHGKGINALIITLGTQGALLSVAGETQLVAAFPAVPKDTTGAGDAFNGALAAQLSSGVALAEAATFASAYASVCVERAGAASSMPTYEEALERQNSAQPLLVQ
ncbi:ribokinase [Serratia sp. M24T3]|uniref:Ribokinase n=1 Tax=Rouxiella sp. WC2420 TaxID=3234145 RepID=A0AB39VSX6_9GAMM|nr:ribokinase [Serratia sp. M24T3]EIC83498.1 PfkB domain-containing protein [Serratia sp. M24T3]